MEWLITNSLASALIPPGSLLLLAAIGALLALRRPRTGRSLVALALVALYALSTHFVSDALLKSLEPAPRNPLADKSGQAIVVLGGGTYFSAPEYGGDTVSTSTLARLRYAAHLHRALNKPVMVTSGAPQGNPVSEAALMKQVLETDFRVPVRWTEKASRNTLENARLSRLVLEAARRATRLPAGSEQRASLGGARVRGRGGHQGDPRWARGPSALGRFATCGRFAKRPPFDSAR